MLVWVAFIVFTLGSLYRLIDMFMLVNKKEKFILSYMSWRYGLRSILHWIIPFGSEGWRSHPAMTIVTFAFHICLIIIPVFLSCIFFLIRRLTSPEVKFVTSVSDYVILAIVAAPFITGFLAYHQWVEYQLIAILHILSGEIMLMAIPFTRLSHMLFSPLTRAYMGSEFGGIKNAKDW